ncbi:hypothetical protein RW1_104_00030 [Rhodococcus wratislaviensis NBRC 100605]|uniref:Uncharacterized protein n=1 Tax=Rhodococcus wratislaviensis NBRC 100605 TaxID=1219028 RepID=X0QKZ4_RHOWR|nr:hypothetical protein RW1_104_00030 [Rhodococcus wratislaviensis NBRC 100605]
MNKTSRQGQIQPHRRAFRRCNYLTPDPTRPVAAARFDDPNLMSTAGLVPVMDLAQASGLLTLADQHLSVPTDKGANPGPKIGSLVGGMVAGADSITDLAILRHGAMGTIFDRPYAPSTLDRSFASSPSGTSGNSPPSPRGS